MWAEKTVVYWAAETADCSADWRADPSVVALVAPRANLTAVQKAVPLVGRSVGYWAALMAARMVDH